MPGMEDAVLMAQEQIMQDLISGNNFRGLGTSARLIVLAIAADANENAKIAYGDHTTRTTSDFKALEQACQEQFVLDILGFEDERFTPQQAARRLVERVYRQYLEWAEKGRLQAMREASEVAVKRRIEG